MCTRQSRKVTWDMIYTLFLTTLAVEPTFVAFFQHSQTHFHGLSCQFFQISLKNSELKTTHNAFRDCRVHFFDNFLEQLSADASSFLFSHYRVFSLTWQRRGQHICKFIGTKESVCKRKEFNSQRIGLGHQHGCRFIVSGHQYGLRDVM